MNQLRLMNRGFVLASRQLIKRTVLWLVHRRFVLLWLGGIFERLLLSKENGIVWSKNIRCFGESTADRRAVLWLVYRRFVLMWLGGIFERLLLSKKETRSFGRRL